MVLSQIYETQLTDKNVNFIKVDQLSLKTSWFTFFQTLKNLYNMKQQKRKRCTSSPSLAAILK